LDKQNTIWLQKMVRKVMKGTSACLLETLPDMISDQWAVVPELSNNLILIDNTKWKQESHDIGLSCSQ
jgi:hypothetical protein